MTLASYLFGKPVINYIKRELKAKFKSKFSDNEISDGIRNIITNSICAENIKPIKEKKKREPKPFTPMTDPLPTTNQE